MELGRDMPTVVALNFHLTDRREQRSSETEVMVDCGKVIGKAWIGSIRYLCF